MNGGEYGAALYQQKKAKQFNGLVSAPPVCYLVCQGHKWSWHRHVADMVEDCLAFCSEINLALTNYVLLQYISDCSKT